jgi:NarL family two-component system sensor histidine kinase LiaS
MMSIPRRFSSLQWKLAASYVVVILVTVLVVEGLVILAAHWLDTRMTATWTSQSALDRAERLAQLAAEPWTSDSPTQLARALDRPLGVQSVVRTALLRGYLPHWDIEARVIVGEQGRVLVSNQPQRYPMDSLFIEPGLPEAETLVAQALAEGVIASRLAEEPHVFVAAIPVADHEGHRLGAVYYREPVPDASQSLLSRLRAPLLAANALLLPCMIPLGLVLGFATAFGFTRRLRRLTEASNALAGGDLGRRVHDTSGDEIGQLARQFNAMAGQLETDTTELRELADHNAQLALKAQRLAALEERHRLARELHDGVKQYLFGVNLATAAALNLLEDDPERARAKLLEARELSRQAQAELMALLNELRPAGLDERGLVAAVTDYVATFEEREGVTVQWRAPAELSLPLAQEQALFRVAQEALTNVARHADATRVTVELEATPEAVVLQVDDDGMGFDPASIPSGPTMGLQGMRERLAALGGELTVDAAPGRGTRLVANLPRPADTGKDKSGG